jgi:hypothetical protein
MKIRLGELRKMIREHFRHGSAPHQRTTDSKRVLKAMQDSPTLQKAFDTIDQPRELAGIIEELIDATGMSREQIQRALSILYRHEKPRRW